MPDNHDSGFASPSNVPPNSGADEPTREHSSIPSDPRQDNRYDSDDGYRDGDYRDSGYRSNWRDGEAGYHYDSHDHESPKQQSALWKWLSVAAVAALIGALVGGGVATALADNGSPQRADQRSTTLASQEATPNNIREVLEAVQPAVVAISANGPGGQGSGTGMVISSDGEILTNNHVVAGASQIRVTFSNETSPRNARLLGTDSTLDTALLKVDGAANNLTTVRFGNSDDTQVGDEVVAIGNALALTGGPSVTSGIVSAKDRSISDGGTSLENLIQTDTAINPGNSGGPLVNMAGEVVGMNTAVIRGSGGEFENIGFAIAINSVQPIIEDLRQGVTNQPAFLGLTSVTLNEELRSRFELTPERGVVVSQIFQGTPADSAGLSRFDVITKFDGKEVAESEALVREVRAKKPGDEVQITYFRGDQQRETTVRLAARPTSAN